MKKKENEVRKSAALFTVSYSTATLKSFIAVAISLCGFKFYGFVLVWHK